jgi:hypothetical protein
MVQAPCCPPTRNQSGDLQPPACVLQQQPGCSSSPVLPVSRLQLLSVDDAEFHSAQQPFHVSTARAIATSLNAAVSGAAATNKPSHPQ